MTDAPLPRPPEHPEAEGLRAVIEPAHRGERDPRDGEVVAAVERAVELLDLGEVRVAAPDGEGGWAVHAWVKMAVLLFFGQRPMVTMNAGDLTFLDRVPVKTPARMVGVRVVPPAVARYGSHLEPGVVLMPSYVNIGARVGAGSMVDTWATVGSCAQVGRDVHLSGGVGIGGVLEPVVASPVVIEDGAFVGSRCIVVEGVRVGAGAVLGANVVLTASTPVIDVRGSEPVEWRGHVPARAVVIPGTRPRRFPAGEYGVPAALIIATRSEATDAKTSLNLTLREHGIAV